MNSFELFKRIATFDSRVNALFDAFILELANSGYLSQVAAGAIALTSFSKYPTQAKEAAKIAKKFSNLLNKTMMHEIRGSIALATAEVHDSFKPYSRITDNALDSFRKSITDAYIESRVKPEKGLSLSQRVWNYTEQTKAEFELGLSQVIEDGIRKGTSAEEIGRAVREKLRNPDMMYRRYHVKKAMSDGTKKDVVEWRRRVVDADGTVHFVKEDLAKVGTGVYRSARQNALRMAGSEITNAYYYAENMQYQKEPFVLGYRINLSNNHTCKDSNGVPQPFHDICDDLAGDYPKWFLWKSWHPRCRCFMTAILCSEDEMRVIAKLPKEEYENYISPNAIKDLPKNYTDYVDAHADRIAGAVERGKQAYWIQDNYVDGDPTKGLLKRTAPKEIAPASSLEEAIKSEVKEKKRISVEDARRLRHAKRDAEDIQRRWDKRFIEHWEWKEPQFPTDATKFDDDYLRKKVNYVVVSSATDCGYFSERTIKKWGRISLINTYETYANMANRMISIRRKEVELTHRMAQIIASDDRTHPAAIHQMRKYLTDMNDIEGWAYLNRLDNNLEGFSNLQKLIHEKNVDFSKISPNMPIDLLPDSTTYPMRGRVLDKRLFDSLDYYTPVKIDTKDGGYHSSGQLFVHLNSKAKRGERHEINVIYHEYGHALDVCHDLYGEADVDKLMKEFDKEYKVVLKKTETEEVNGYDSIDFKLENDYYTYRNAQDLDHKEMVMDLMDVVQALSKGKYGHRDIDGHGTASYWKGGEWSTNHPHTEFVAHMSECFFLGNEYIKKQNADLYNKMVALFELLFIKK